MMRMEIRQRRGLPRMRFHVMNRGARKVDIYANDEDRELFVTLLAKAALKYHVSVVAWCLMSNHYHLETEGEGTPLTRMMHDLDGSYARIYNERHEGSGALFQGRFKSMAVVGDDGLVYVSRYIHANPMVLNIQPEDYPWSSCRSYLGMGATPAWLDPTPVLALVGGEAAYREYLSAAPPPKRAASDGPDDRLEFYRQYVRHLGIRCFDAAQEAEIDLREVSARSLFWWIARKRYGIPRSILRELDSVGRADTRSADVWRLDRRRRRDPALKAALDRVCAILARAR